MKRVLLVGLDPATVNFSDPALPPGMTVERIHKGVETALADMAERGWRAENCFIKPDDTAVPVVERRLAEGRYDPTIVVGGRVTNLGSNARLGQGDYLVAEADESDRSFLKLSPTLAVVTNIDREHLDAYRDLHDIQDAFVGFANKVPFYGAAAETAAVPKIKAPLLVQYAESDERINSMWPAYEQALKASGAAYAMHIYPGTQHGFHNNSTPRYNEAAAKLAWERTLEFFGKYLKG